MQNVKFRDTILTHALASDYADIANIYNEHIQQKRSTMEESIHDAAMIQKWVDAFNDREGLFVLKRENKNIGWGIIKKYSTREGYRFACETAIYLRGDETRKGYGSFIKKALIQRCKELNYHHLIAKIFAINEASIQYNLQLGYEIVGRQKEIGFKDGKWTDVVIMQYIIRD